MQDVLILLTGRHGHGKDTAADIAVEKLGCSGRIALADSLKLMLAEATGVPVAKFYDGVEKDKPLDRPIVLDQVKLRSLVRVLRNAGLESWARIATSNFNGRQFTTLRELMVWFGEKFVKPNATPDFFCRLVAKRLAGPEFVSKEGQPIRVILITDVRFIHEAEFFLKNYPLVYPIRITRPDGPTDKWDDSVDAFPDSIFFDTLINDGTQEDLEAKLVKIFASIKTDVQKRVKEVSVQTAQPQSRLITDPTRGDVVIQGKKAKQGQITKALPKFDPNASLEERRAYLLSLERSAKQATAQPPAPVPAPEAPKPVSKPVELSSVLDKLQKGPAVPMTVEGEVKEATVIESVADAEKAAQLPAIEAVPEAPKKRTRTTKVKTTVDPA